MEEGVRLPDEYQGSRSPGTPHSRGLQEPSTPHTQGAGHGPVLLLRSSLLLRPLQGAFRPRPPVRGSLLLRPPPRSQLAGSVLPAGSRLHSRLYSRLTRTQPALTAGFTAGFPLPCFRFLLPAPCSLLPAGTLCYCCYYYYYCCYCYATLPASCFLVPSVREALASRPPVSSQLVGCVLLQAANLLAASYCKQPTCWLRPTSFLLPAGSLDPAVIMLLLLLLLLFRGFLHPAPCSLLPCFLLQAATCCCVHLQAGNLLPASSFKQELAPASPSRRLQPPSTFKEAPMAAL